MGAFVAFPISLGASSVCLLNRNIDAADQGSLQPGTWASKLATCQLTDFGSLPCRQPRLLCARPVKFVEKAARNRGRRRGHLSHIAAGRNPELANAARGRSLTVAALYCRARPRKSLRVPKTLWCSTTPNQGFASRVGQASWPVGFFFNKLQG